MFCHYTAALKRRKAKNRRVAIWLPVPFEIPHYPANNYVNFCPYAFSIPAGSAGDVSFDPIRFRNSVDDRPPP